MNSTSINYDLLLQDAMRGMLRDILKTVAKSGLPGEHHFYIIFDTRAPGVQISNVLKSQYPGEMTIVLQHQFWGLEVTDNFFKIQLSFNRQVEDLLIPFKAITGFFDPSVQYGIQFSAIEEQVAEDANALAEDDDDHVVAYEPQSRKPDLRAVPQTGRKTAGAEEEQAGPDQAADHDTVDHDGAQTPDKSGAEIVKLDLFRKK